MISRHPWRTPRARGNCMPFAYDYEQEAFAETVTETLRRYASMDAVRELADAPERWM